MAAKNKGLAKAKDAKKDEFYTTYDDIQVEINHYESKFEGKTVFCNCDDPFESNFCKFFLRNFNYLKLKRLICTSYSTSPVVAKQMSLFDLDDEPVVKGNGYVIDITSVPMANGRGVSDEDIDRLLKSPKRGVKRLQGDGDFRSEECIQYLKKADIVVTNPPFSLFREFVSQLIEYKKEFLIIGNVNAITYKEIFPLIKNNQLWLGASIHSGDRKFYVPDDYSLQAAGCGIDDTGRKFIRVKGVRWFTNLDYAIRHEKLDLYKKYYGNEAEYPKYDNYDAINVNKTAEIPCDYFEDIGVPITYLDKHNPEQFEIVKFRKGNDEKDLTYSVSDSNMLTKDEGRRTKDEGRRTKDEGRRTKDEGRRTKDEGRRT
ncbi:adenine-specific methyltransferase EcoRI family protein, partial [Veillonella magna]|uniref:adenine-specific methyltransferase EcoRI family protein n=1 Tax=Veillonella magna TaxID=464322 RepID=UPI003B9766E4